MSSSYNQNFNHRILCFNSGSININAGANLNIPFDKNIYDTIESHNTIVNNSRIVIKDNFNLIKPSYFFQLIAAAAGVVNFTYKLNGNNISPISIIYSTNVVIGSNSISPNSPILQTSLNDFWEINILNNTAAAITILGATGYFAAEFGNF